MPETSCIRAYKIFTTILLVFINLLNYVDRFAVAPLVDNIANYFGVSYGDMGVVPTVFVCVHMVFAPAFGRLGDIYSRRILVSLGVAMWTLPVIAGTFLSKNAYWAFVFFQGAAGIGQASFVTIPPAMIADLYIGDARSMALMAFYMAIPVGAGLGYVMSSKIAMATNSWQWGIRIPPIFGFCAALIFLTAYDPPRGALELEGTTKSKHKTRGSFTDGLFRVLSVPTYVCTTFASAAVLFTLGAISFWAPTVLMYVQKLNNNGKFNNDQMCLILGVITATGGLSGTTLGSTVATMWRKRNKRADCLVCAYSTLLGSFFLFIAVILAKSSLNYCYFNLFLAVCFLSFSWAVVTDIQLAVVDPHNRALACGLHTMISHLLGDAASPYILGAASDAFRGGDTTDLAYYYSFRSSFCIGSFISAIGASVYFLAAQFVERDLKRQEKLPAVDEKASINNNFSYTTLE